MRDRLRRKYLSLGIGEFTAIGIAAAWPLRPWVLVLSAAVLLFAVVEYVNYYVARLAYPVSRWFTEVGQWRTPRLMIDVNETA